MRSFNRLKYLLYFGLLAVAHGGVVAPTCTASGTCPKNYCCLRDPEWNDINKACAPLSKVDSECYVPNNELLAKFRSSVYNNACPCEKGYVCRSVDDGSITGICVKECSLNTDCPSDRCCATESSPGTRGKRSLGVCRKLGTANEPCYVEDNIRYDDDANFWCPCASGFYCQGNGTEAAIFPVMDRGVCVPVDTNDKAAVPGK